MWISNSSIDYSKVRSYGNPFHATGFILYPLKTSETWNQWRRGLKTSLGSFIVNDNIHRGFVWFKVSIWPLSMVRILKRKETSWSNHEKYNAMWSIKTPGLGIYKLDLLKDKFHKIMQQE